MRTTRTHWCRSVALVALVAGCNEDPAADATRSGVDPVTVSFTGTVLSIRTGDAGVPPAGIAVGAIVSGSLRYVPGHSQLVQRDRTHRVYAFTDDARHRITVRIGSTTWTLPLRSVAVGNDAADGDRLDCSATTGSAAEFPGSRGRDLVHLTYSDPTPPYDLVASAQLPVSAPDVRFDLADFQRGVVASGSTLGDWWEVAFEVDASTFP